MAKDDELLPGWVLVSEWDQRSPGCGPAVGPSGDYNRLLKACRSNSVRAYKQDGEWVVNKSDADGYLGELRLLREKAAAKPQVADSASCSGADAIGRLVEVAVRIADAMDRIAYAAESHATDPVKAEG